MDNFSALVGKLIRSPVGNNLENKEDDVRKVKKAFSELGYYKRPVENGIIDQELDTAIHSFQKDKNLKVDGYMKPGGETERELLLSLNNKAEKKKSKQRKQKDL
jgi:peptidoglycan hydrolase-like protein with peptidoglycan-binding domain